MVEDAPVNVGAPDWPSAELAADRVRRMQIKLHCWARENPVRCFDDLYQKERVRSSVCEFGARL